LLTNDANVARVLTPTKLEVRATYEHTDGCRNLQLSYRKKTARCSMFFSYAQWLFHCLFASGFKKSRPLAELSWSSAALTAL